MTSEVSSRPSPRHLTPLDLSALRLGALPADESRVLLEHVDHCLACQAERARHDRDAARFAEEGWLRTLPAVRRRATASRRAQWWRLLLWLGPPVLAMASVAFWLRPRVGPASREATWTPAGNAVNIKGQGSLQVFARREDQVFLVSDGAVLTAGDAIRFLIDPPGMEHVVIGSVDGAGRATIYFPYQGPQSARIDPRRRLEVPGSIILDEAPGPERLFAVFSSQPMASDLVRTALEGLGAQGEEAIRSASELPLPGTAQATLRFEKGRSVP
jgi:hypothetical protein